MAHWDSIFLKNLSGDMVVVDTATFLVLLLTLE